MFSVVVESRDILKKDIGHLGRQECIFLATKFITKTGMKRITDMIPSVWVHIDKGLAIEIN